MTSAQHLALRFDASHSPLRAGTSERHDFDAWLARFWRQDCPPEPDTCPDAVSVLGGAGGSDAVRWYDADDVVFGYLPGSPRRCFQIPFSVAEPSFADVLDEDGPDCDGDDHDLGGGAAFGSGGVSPAGFRGWQGVAGRLVSLTAFAP